MTRPRREPIPSLTPANQDHEQSIHIHPFPLNAQGTTLHQSSPEWPKTDASDGRTTESKGAREMEPLDL